MSEHSQKNLSILKSENIMLREKLQLSNAAFMNIVGRSRDGILIISSEGRILYANPAAIKLFNQNLGSLLGSHFGLPVSGDKIFEIQIANPKLGLVTVEVSLVDTIWHDKTALLASLRDVTLRKKALDALKHLAKHDVLTNLPNRILFEEELIKAVARAKRSQTSMALLYLDMDDFKRINDSLGHDVGDKLLLSAGNLLQQCLRETDTVARLGGDEFAIILDEIQSPMNASMVAKKILSVVQKPISIDDSKISITFSIGIAVYPVAGLTAKDLLKSADMAMYAAKKAGRNRFHFFTSSLNVIVKRRAILERHLEESLQKKEFYLAYQPIVSVHDLKISGIEVLLRWESSELGQVPVSEFLPLLEDTGHIAKVGEWVIGEACAQYLSSSAADMLLSVNLSMCQLLDNKLVDSFLRVIAQTSINPQSVVLELTESIIMTDTKNVISRMNKIAETGVRLAIDDFGTGYSSFTYLKELPVSILKIDQSFVRDIHIDPNNTIIVKSIIALAKELNLQTIAEGVETKAQKDFLVANGCDMMQGYYFSKPVDFFTAIK